MENLKYIFDLITWPVSLTIAGVATAVALAVFTIVLRQELRWLSSRLCTRYADFIKKKNEALAKEPDKAQARRRALYGYIVLPTIGNVIFVCVTVLYPEGMVGHAWLVWIIALSSFFVTLSVVNAYFEDGIGDVLAWFSMVLNGLITIGVFPANESLA